MIASDQAPEGADWLSRRVTALEGLVRELLAGRRLERATIGSGGLTIKGGGDLTIRDGGGVKVLDNGDLSVQGGIVQFLDGDGNQRVYIGPLNYSGFTPGIGWVFRRHNGQIVLSLEGADPTNQFLAIRDEAGNIIVSDDAVTGQGLATPYVPGAFESMSVPADSNGTGTFTGLQKAIWRKQHPRAKFTVLANVTSTTAEIRWKIVSGADSGTVIGGPVTLNNGFGFNHYGPYSVPGAHLSEFEIDLEARVASGTGSVAVRTLHAIGLQS